MKKYFHCLLDSMLNPPFDLAPFISKDFAANLKRDLVAARSFFIASKPSCWSLDDLALKHTWNTQLDLNFLSSIRLPYPAMAISYDFCHSLLGLGDPKPGLSEVPKRCAIVIDDNDRFHFFLGMQISRPPMWHLVDYSCTVPYSDLPKWEINKGGEIRCALFRNPSVDAYNHLDLDHSWKANPMADDILVVLGLMQVLACKNTPVAEEEPPKFLNRKRQKKGKVPITNYRYVNLKQLEATFSSSSTNTGLGKPRSAHMRRGHIHRYWVNGKLEPRWLPPIWVKGSLDSGVHPKQVVATAK